MRRLVELIELGLATWRASYMLVYEAGPNGLFIKLRELSGVRYDDTTGEVVSWNDWSPLVCIWCTSVYVASVVAFMPKKLVTVLAISGITVIIDKCLGVQSGFKR